MKQGLLFLTAVALLQTGCGYKVYMVAETDPEFKNRRPDFEIIVRPLPQATIQEKKVAYMAKEEMRRRGFKIVDVAGDEGFVLGVSMGFHNYQSEGTLFLPFTSTTTGKFGGVSYKEKTTELREVSYTSSQLNYQISLYLYYFKGQDKFDLVWRGYLDLETEDYEKNPEFFISKMLDHIWKDKKEFERWYPTHRKEKSKRLDAAGSPGSADR